jgi:hypothetical protein
MRAGGRRARAAVLLSITLILAGTVVQAAYPGDAGREAAAAEAAPVPLPSAPEPALPQPADAQPAALEPAVAEPRFELYPWQTPRPTAPNWSGAGRDAFYFVSYQVFGVAVLYLMPESISGWTEEDKRDFSFDQWRHNVSNPVVWDGDSFVVNWVLHPYWGATYYSRARERGLSPEQSFAYSAALSALWEYGAEAIAEPVSVQDLVFTPLLGALLGAYVFEPWRDHIRAREGELDWVDHAILALTDPLGVINAKVNQWLGIRGEGMQLQLTLGRPAHRMIATPGAAAPLRAAAAAPAPGARSGRAWGFSLHLAW